MILYLKALNFLVNAPHFKMESIHNVIYMVQHNSWMASIDLKNAFYFIPVKIEYQKVLKCLWDLPYQYTAMPNGYAHAMRIFTKILKPPFSLLQKLGHQSVVYVDDTLLIGSTFIECAQNIDVTIDLLQLLGFNIHPKKSVLIPTKSLEFLGYIINTEQMTLTLTTWKKEKIKKLCDVLFSKEKPTIRLVAQLLRNMVAAFEAVPFGRLCYQLTEKDKIEALKNPNGNFDCHMTLSEAANLELVWWEQNISESSRSLIELPITDTILTDASNMMWGAPPSLGKLMADGLTKKRIFILILNLWLFLLPLSHLREISWVSILQL